MTTTYLKYDIKYPFLSQSQGIINSTGNIHECENQLHHLPLSYIEIPVFGSTRKGNLQENFKIVHTMQKNRSDLRENALKVLVIFS